MDYVERARSMSRSAFIDRYPQLFLIGTQRLVAPAGPQQTIRAELVERGGKLAFAEPLPTTPEPRLSPIVRAIVKTQAAFPAMITVGRTPNNDVDAGSRNGTFVGVERLPPKEPRLVSTGSLLRFGSLELTLVDAARCWDHATAF